MRQPLKVLMVTIPLLMVGLVGWHLQHPTRVAPEQESCANNQAERDAVAQCRQDTEKKSGTPATATLVGNLHLFQMAGEQLEWRLLAPSAQDDGTSRIHVRQPDLHLYDKEGENASVSAQEGTVNSSTQIMTFSGQVVAVNAEQRLTSEILHFDPARKMLYTQQPFVWVDASMRLEGVGLTVMRESQSMSVQHNVRVQFFHVGDEVTREKDDDEKPRS
ncbi:MAG: LPS export ABC transporter periplasmic protein LptC [Magnetococcales bacterium]|nr:LPS export ABC transporter periplasmic protein LptC [Magnetococcales bacterium]MBF0113514.1 LPS export ABC transporter periplasmic protein LptC [Magnetococcales bacterium]